MPSRKILLDVEKLYEHQIFLGSSFANEKSVSQILG